MRVKTARKRVRRRMRTKTTRHPRVSARPAAGRRSKKAAPASQVVSVWAVLVAIVVAGAVALIAAPRPFQHDIALGAPTAASAAVESVATPPLLETKAPVAAPSDAGRAVKLPAAAAVASKAEHESSRSKHTDAALAPPPPMESVGVRADPAPVVKSEAENAATITIGGCLERKDTRFRLTDTVGSDAPKSRSWKSGFLRKHASAVDLVDAANTLELPAHVGQRVSATGTFVNGEMRARSLQRVSSSCR